MGYSLGFSWKGLLVFLLPMIVNIFYFFSKMQTLPEAQQTVI